MPVWIVYSQPLFHFFSNVVITPKPFPTDGIFEGSREAEIWGSKNWGVWWWVQKNSPSEFWDCFLCFQTCLWPCILCWRRILATFSWGWTLAKCLCKGLRAWMYGSELMVWPCGIMSIKLTCYSSQKAVNSDHDFSSWRSNLKLSISWMIPFYWLSFVHDLRWQICVSSPVTIHDNKLFLSAS